MIQYISCTKNIDASELAELLLYEIYFKLRALRSIVSDKESLFTSKWWSTFCYYMIVKKSMLTAFYSQTDRQTEQMNQTLECYLCYYINY